MQGCPLVFVRQVREVTTVSLQTFTVKVGFIDNALIAFAILHLLGHPSMLKRLCHGLGKLYTD